MQKSISSSLSVTIIGRLKILKIKYTKEKPVYYNIIAHLTIGFSDSPAPKFKRDIAKVNVYVNCKGVHVVRTATLYFLKFVWLNLQVEHFNTAGFAQNFTKQTCIKLKQN